MTTLHIGDDYTAEILGQTIVLRLQIGGQWVAQGFEAAAVREIARLAAALEAARVDAERYRVVRELDWFNSPLAVVAKPREAIKLGFDCPTRERLDAAVDVIRAIKRGAA